MKKPDFCQPLTWRVIQNFAILLCVLTISSCSMVSEKPQAKPTATQDVAILPSASPTLSLPALNVDHGWHEVLHLQNLSNTTEILGGKFVATNPYNIIAACAGTGKLTVNFTPQGETSFNCALPPRSTFSQIGTQQNPPKKEPVQVTVTSKGLVRWEVLIEIQNKQTGASYQQAQIPVGKTVVAYPPGGKAITPHLNAIPSYTTGDVRQFILASGLDQTTTAGTPSTITKIAFMTTSQASTLLQGESIGRPDGAMVCYVELRGPFTIEGPVPAGATLPTAQRAYDIFDAQTGNILMWGYFMK